MPKAYRRRFLRKGLGLIAVCAIVLCAMLGLGVLRFHAARLSYHLNSINISIQQYVNEETALKQELSALLAPVNIYTYCKENLKMQKVTNAETLPVRRVDSVSVARESAPTEKKGWGISLAWLFGE